MRLVAGEVRSTLSRNFLNVFTRAHSSVSAPANTTKPPLPPDGGSASPWQPPAAQSAARSGAMSPRKTWKSYG